MATEISLVEQHLLNLGLSEREARTYMALNRHGSLSVQELGRRTSIPRPSLYPILKALELRGLVAQEVRSRRHKFCALAPAVFADLVEREQSKLAEHKKSAEALLHLLNTDLPLRADVSPKVFFFEGKTQIEQMLYHFQTEWRASYRRLGMFTMWGYQDHTFVEQYRRWHNDAWKTRDPREEIKLFSNAEGARQQSQEKIARRELRVLPVGINFTSSIWVHGEYVILANTRANPHYATVQIDANLSANLRQLFQMLWILTKACNVPSLPQEPKRK